MEQIWKWMVVNMIPVAIILFIVAVPLFTTLIATTRWLVRHLLLPGRGDNRMSKQHWRDMKEAAIVEDELHWFMLNLERRGIRRGRRKQMQLAIRALLNLPSYVPKSSEELKGEIRHRLNGRLPEYVPAAASIQQPDAVDILDLLKRSK